jgi:putative PEP-CTERM system histidine kinase
MLISILAIVVLLVCMARILQLELNRAGLILVAPLLATALLEACDLGAFSGSVKPIPWNLCSLCLEALLPSLWLLCSLTYARDPGPGKLTRTTQVITGASLLLVAVPIMLPNGALIYAPDFPAERILFLTDIGYYYYVAIMLMLVAALANFEATLAQASPDAFWRVKLDIVALGSILAVLIFYYSNALLFRTIETKLVPLRSLLVIVAAALMTYARINWRGGARVKVSQKVQLKSVVIGVVAIYLLFLGGVGEGMQYFGPLFPRVLALFFVFSFGIVLLLLILSERAKRTVKVLLHKNFGQSKYDYRFQWLSLTQRLDSFESGEDLLKRVLAAYCDIFGVNGAALFLYQDGRDFYCATAIREMEQMQESISRENSLVRFLEQKGWVFCCSSSEGSPILAENRELLVRHQVSFVIPLFQSSKLTGFITLGERLVRYEKYGYEDYDLMKTIASQAAIAIQDQRLSEELMQARSMEAVGNLATFIVHDLKNLVAAVSLVVENAGEHLANPEFQQDMLGTLRNTTEKMLRLIGRLKNLGESQLFLLHPTDLLSLVRKIALLAGNIVAVQGTPELALVCESELQKVLLNLFLNAIDASQGEGVLAEVGSEGAPYIRITDRGCGMSSEFIRKDLFNPFCSSKQQGLGIGLYQCRQIVGAHGGRIDVVSKEGAGTVFTVWLQAPAGAGSGLVSGEKRGEKHGKAIDCR